jgi:hypothetical protein
MNHLHLLVTKIMMLQLILIQDQVQTHMQENQL